MVTLAMALIIMTAIIFVRVYPRKIWVTNSIATVAVAAAVLAIRWDWSLALLTALWLAILGIVIIGKVREERRMHPKT